MPLFERRNGWLLFFCVATGYYLYRTVLALLPHIGPQPSDFSAYYAAAQAVLLGKSPFSADGFIYAPLLAFLLAPLAYLDYHTARWAWFWLSHGCLFASGFLIWKTLGGDRLSLLVTAAIWAAGGAASESLLLGQVNPLLLLLIAITWHSGKRRLSVGAASLGVATATKVWPGTLLTTYVLSRDWKGLVVATLTVALLAAAPWMAVGFFLPDPHAPALSSAWTGTPALFNFSVPAIVLRLLDPPVSGARLPTNWEFGNSLQHLRLSAADSRLSLSAGIATFLLGLVLLARAIGGHLTQRQAHLGLAGLTALTLAASPICWSHYQLLQYPGAAYLLARFIRQRRLGYATSVIVLFWGLYEIPIRGLGPYLRDYGWTAGNPFQLWLFTSLTPVCSLFLFGLCILELRRRSAEEQAA